MLVKYTPASLFNTSALDRAFNEFFNTSDLASQSADISPRISVSESDNAWSVNAELPGVAKEDVKLNFQEGVLSISGEKKSVDLNEGETLLREERSYGTFSRALKIKSPIKQDNIEALFKDGVLTVNLPKAEEAKPKLIDIKVK